MSDDLWTIERVESEHADLAPLARLHRVLADETLRFATDGAGPPPRPAFSGPPALHWLAGRSLLAAARPDVLHDLASRLVVRLARRLAAEFPEVAVPATEIAAAAEAPEFPWADRIARVASEPTADDGPHPALFHFLLLRALSAPASHLARSFSPPHLDRWAKSSCPFCGLPPGASLAGTGSDRRMICVLCGGRWAVQGLGCPSCGERRRDRLRVLASRETGPASLEACDECGLAVKVFHESFLVPGPPLALEILTARLDLVAERDEGLTRDPVARAAIFPPA